MAEKAARQAISRAAAAGWITRLADGRRAAWLRAPPLRRNMELGLERVRSIGAVTDHWDGTWLVLHVSLPEERRAIRVKMYKSLRWSGCG